jgi:hypothetical protein
MVDPDGSEHATRHIVDVGDVSPRAAMKYALRDAISVIQSSSVDVSVSLPSDMPLDTGKRGGLEAQLYFPEPTSAAQARKPLSPLRNNQRL